MPTNKEVFEAKMNTLADKINTKAGTTGKKGLDELATAVDSIQPGVTPTGNQDIKTLEEYDVSTKATARVWDVERAKCIPGNIKSGITLLGVSGKSSVVDTDDATATAADIASGKTAYVNGVKIVGTAGGGFVVTKGTITWDASNFSMGLIFIKVDDAPTGESDYDYGVWGSVGPGSTTLPGQFNAAKLYIWGDGHSSIDSPVSVSLSSHQTYSTAYELTLNSDITLSLTCSIDE